jgi:hypothetical protein
MRSFFRSILAVYRERKKIKNNYINLTIKFTDKEEETLIEKNKSTNLLKEIETLKTTLASREDYISNLKTEDEIKEMEQIVNTILDIYLKLFCNLVKKNNLHFKIRNLKCQMKLII